MEKGYEPRRSAPRPSVVHLPAGAPLPATLLEFLVERFPAVGVEIWRERFAGGRVLGRDGSPLAATTPCRPQLQVRYFREAPGEERLFGAPRIVFENEELLVADKPPFQPVVPSGPFVVGCLLYEIAALLEKRGETANALSPLHRLDRATSGLVLFSRRAESRGLYARLFEERRVEKLYEAKAVVAEPPAERRFRRRSRIVPGEPFFRMREEEGEPNAETEIFLRELAWEEGRRIGHFELRPVTGRKHQLRVQMASLGWPILGDRWYPELLAEAPDDQAEPLRLLAREVAFRDPRSGEELRFRSGRSG